MTSVTLAPYTSDQRDALCALAVGPEQERFSSQPRLLLENPQDGIDVHLIYVDATLVGMFRIDRDFSREHPQVPSGAYGLRSMIIDQRHQGRGIGTAMIRALPAYMAQRYPQATQIYLTVNLRNPGARRSYLNGGFTDTGEHYLGGDAGPQHILRMNL
ncbi:GNAT family N-acetyltransferase [Loktanella sp. TSTF-M6]|uniref:GNAT family N-acetyltransferase n=1 Tax=Loktanella gaetbuli TaxID=2881335 RepID=A0ABS8BS36_9RHOB|nr:GNAT family protein [Loktanella gaetbuli]MCB5198536.1 GNAT family N-acetyltransferase [Loktanella gaetbuli]